MQAMPEAKYYSMVEGVLRAKGIVHIALELGISGVSDNKIILHTDSSAAKSHVSRLGFGRMRDIQVKHLWLQKEVADQKLVSCFV